MVPKKAIKAMSQNNPNTSPKRVVGYIRISSERQTNNESPATQRDAIQRYADANNMEVVAWFEDIAKSGKNADRAGIQSMLEYCLKHRGEIDHWVVYNMKRASRDIDTYSSEVRLVLKARGVTVRSATEPSVVDTKEGRLMENLLVMLAQYDNEGRAEVTKDNMRSLALQGYWQFPSVVGYDTHKVANDAGKPRPTLKQNLKAPLVRQVLERFSRGDITKAELTRYAVDIGLRSKYGKKMGEDAIHKMLKNPLYAGFVTGKLTDHQLVEGKHEPIISRETFEMNQTLLFGKNKRKGEVHQKYNPDYPLRGEVLCMHCKQPLYASAPRTGAGGKSPRYHCSRPSCKGIAKSVKASQMHDDFEDALKRIKPTDEFIKLHKEVLITEAANQLGNLNSKLAKVRSKLDHIAQQRLKATRKFNNDELTLEEKNDLMDDLDKEKLRVQEEERVLEQQQRIRESDIELALNTMRDIDKQWSNATAEAQRRFQKMLFPKGLVYDPETRRFGTTEISPLYRLATKEKDTEVSLNSNLVAGPGLEPGTSWL